MIQRLRSDKAKKIHKESVMLFLNVASRLGYSYNKAPDEKDMSEHWDYKLFKGNRNWKLELKGLKSLDRNSSERTSDIITLELQAVRYKNNIDRPGWLFGTADLIAFQTPSGFSFITRKKLAERAEQLCPNWKTDFKVSPSRNKQLYQCYTRYDDDGITPRHDRFIQVNFDDIKDLVECHWIATEEELTQAKGIWNVQSATR